MCWHLQDENILIAKAENMYELFANQANWQ
jgi:hypothetical protein